MHTVLPRALYKAIVFAQGIFTFCFKTHPFIKDQFCIPNNLQNTRRKKISHKELLLVTDPIYISKLDPRQSLVNE